jgi:hypothetical protein
MLGGPDGTTLFMLTAPSSDPAEVVALRGGRVLVSEAPAPHAGRP